MEYVRAEHEDGRKVQPPFPEVEISRWLEQAHSDVQVDPAFELGLGGTPFDASDESTFWTLPKQFACWWKNNIERKAKFQVLHNDANVPDNCVDERVVTRAMYCRNAIALAQNIKN